MPTINSSKRPQEIFTKWKPWADRTTLSSFQLQLPGIYLLAIFTQSLPVYPDACAQEIIFIEETRGLPIQSHWDKFHRSAFEGTNDLDGGSVYRKLFSDYGENLFVAASLHAGLLPRMTLPFLKNEIPLLTEIKQHLIREYTKKWGKYPVCNSI